MDAGIPEIGEARPTGTVRPVPPPRRPGAVARVGLGLLLLAMATLATASAWRGYQVAGEGCEPVSWADWHLAMRQQCLTPAYVCENMTEARLLEDPELREAYRRAFEAGQPSPLAGLEALVSQMRSSFGCEGARAAPHAAPSPQLRLPPGHPPIDGAPAHRPPSRAPIISDPDTLDI
jgi:hypothetical protein